MFIAFIATASATPLLAKPANDAQCIYESLSEEDREISLILMVDAMVTGETDFENTRTGKEIEYILEDAHNRCLDLYNWSVGESGNAQGYAVIGLLREASAQFLTLIGKDPAPITTYLQKNRASLGRVRALSESHYAGLEKELKNIEWAGDKPETLEIAKHYFSLSWTQEKLKSGFERGIFYE